MKKTISFAILSVFLIHLIGFYAYFVVRQLQIKQEMREAISSLSADQFEIFEFTIDVYQKVKVNDHEVSIDGKMYDHGSPKIENGKVILYAKHDAAEDNLLSFMAEVVNRHTNDSKPVPSVLSSFLTLHFITEEPLQISFLKRNVKQFSVVATNIISLYYPIESPPPQL